MAVETRSDALNRPNKMAVETRRVPLFALIVKVNCAGQPWGRSEQLH